MGTAWRELGAKKTAFKRIVGMVSDIKSRPRPSPSPHYSPLTLTLTLILALTTHPSPHPSPSPSPHHSSQPSPLALHPRQVSDIKKLDLEVCCTLGMLSEEQVHSEVV